MIALSWAVAAPLALLALLVVMFYGLESEYHYDRGSTPGERWIDALHRAGHGFLALACVALFFVGVYAIVDWVVR